MNNALQKYIHLFSRLKRGNTPLGIAPHKPILLLSVLQLFERDLITENKITINADLVGTFKENWLQLVPTLHQVDFTQPFYYLQSDHIKGEHFWFLKANEGYSINNHIKSVKVLATVCAYAYLANDLFLLLLNRESNAIIKEVLLTTYFPNTKGIDQISKSYGYMDDMEGYILNEPEVKMRKVTYAEEDVFVRNGLFKKWIPKLYSRTCAFTGMQLESIYNHNFIDACHIVPFSHSQDDKVTNGIALCPNLHRAFDRGLVSIDENYGIIVSNHLTENEKHPYGLKQLAGKKMLLPIQQVHYPKQEALAWHRKLIFKS